MVENLEVRRSPSKTQGGPQAGRYSTEFLKIHGQDFGKGDIRLVELARIELATS